jgi:hypothetical protein
VLARRLRIAGKRVNDLSDDEHNLLRYYAETERIIHGLVRVPFTSTSGETQARYVVGSREGLLLIFSGMIPGGQDKLEQEFPGRPLCGIRVQLRIDGS